MTSEKQDELKALALRVREHIVRLSTDGGCFTGASLSCADLLVYLYADFLNISPATVDAPDRDFLFLSKGHDVPALYGTFVELGFMPKERLANHLKANDSIYWHPNRSVPGVEFHSGSLGHLPSVGMGVALDNRMRSLKNRTIVITGDGELNEGSVWETVLVAAAQKLSNFTLVIDRNHFQANVATEDLIPLEPLGPKFEAFGWAVQRIDGHDFAQLEAAFGALPFSDNKPSVIICDTVRGRGLPSIEARADRWFCNFSADEVVELLKELHSQEATTLTSETLTVR